MRRKQDRNEARREGGMKMKESSTAYEVERITELICFRKFFISLERKMIRLDIKRIDIYRQYERS
jgi:hypothetical protein